MASLALRRDGAMAIPQEILQMICKSMDRSDLKNARLVCKELNNAAEIPLFHHIYLRRNMDSFCRLRMIVSTPYLAKLVKGIVYSGQMVPGSDEHMDIDTWRHSLFGQSLDSCLEEASRELLESCTRDDIDRYYSNWCAHLHSQRLMQRYDIEGRDLEYAFSKLPQLEEICFGSDDGDQRFIELTEPEQFCSLGREMFVEPDLFSGSDYHIGQFTAMMAAAHRNKKNLKVIKALDLNWEAFQQDHEVLAMMTANMRLCEHFAFIAYGPFERNDRELQIDSLFRNAPHLRTVELNLFACGYKISEKTIDLSRVFLQQCQWPNLESLQLQALSTSEIRFKKFLAAHATSLTSLDLSNIVLRPHEVDEKLHRGSWVKMIQFFRQSLKLREMRFLRILSNEGNENWSIKTPTEAYWLSESSDRDKVTIKERVERYVVEGGEFPLPWPTETESESGWRDVLLDFSPRLDKTWEYRETQRRFER